MSKLPPKGFAPVNEITPSADTASVAVPPPPAGFAPVAPKPPQGFFQEDPEGTAFGRAVERGWLNTKSTLPALAAQKDATVYADTVLTDEDILRDVLLETIRQPAIPEGWDVSTPEAASAAITAAGYPAEWANTFRQVYDIRQRDAAAARPDPAAVLQRGARNLEALRDLQTERMGVPMSLPGERFKAEFAEADDTVLDTLKTYGLNPIDALAFLSETAAESAPQIAAGVGAGILTRNPGVAAVAAGLGTAGMEYGSSVAEFLAEKKVKLSTPADAAALLKNQELMREAAQRGLGRAVTIAAFEAVGMGVAGKQLGKTALGNVAAQTGVQMAAGGGGEAAARAVTGQEQSAKEIITEGLAEGVTAPVDVAGLALGQLGQREGKGLGQDQSAETPAAGTPAPGAPPAPPAGFEPVADAVEASAEPAGPDGVQAPPTDVEAGTEQGTEQVASVEAGTEQVASVEPSTDVEAAPVEPAAPQRSKVYTPDNKEIEVETAVVEADDLLTSDQDGYPVELQPRDRDRAASQTQIEGIANNPNPLRLDQSPESDRGAPIIAPDGGVVESGNGRVMGLRRGYERGTAEGYRAYVVERHPEAANMKNPVLVRRRVTDVDRQDFTVASNQSATLAMSATENAQSDARLVDDDVVGLYRGGDILGANNRDMVRAFLRRLPQAVQGALVTSEGGLSVDGQRRFEAAIFSRAFGDAGLLARLTERTDDDLKSVTNALRSAAPSVARLNNAIQRGEVSPDVDIAPHVVAAMQTLADIRSRGTNLRDHRAQQDAFAEPLSPVAEAILDAFHNDAGTRLSSQKDMQDFLETFAASAVDQKVDQASLPGVEAAPLKNAEEIASETADKRREAEPDQGAFFDQSDAGTPDGGRPDARRTPERQSADGGGGREAGGAVEDKALSRAPRGGLTPQTKDVSFSRGEERDKAAWTAAGMTPEEGATLPPAKRREVLHGLLETTFGFARVTSKPLRSILKAVDAVDQMLSAYRNLRFMAHALNLPGAAMGLNGFLGLSLERFRGQYLGAYSPDTKTIHMPGRSNSFAHEWFHALDHFLSEKLTGPNNADELLSRVTRRDGLPNGPGSLAEAYVNLIYKVFFDQSDLAMRTLDLERRAQAVIQKGPDAGKPTKGALKAQQQLADLQAGKTRLRIRDSEFRQNSKDFGGKNPAYWASVHEMLARAFEAYVAHKVDDLGGGNAFITKGEAAYLSDADERLRLTFPKNGERAAIFQAFDEVFDALRAEAAAGVNTGPAQAKPDDAAVFDPMAALLDAARINSHPVTDGLTTDFRRIVNGIKRLPSTVAALRNGVSGPALASGWQAAATAWRYVADQMTFLVNTVRGEAEKTVSRAPAAARPALQAIADKLMSAPGSGRTVRETMLEESRTRLKKASNAIEAVLLTSGILGNIAQRTGRAMNVFAARLSAADNDAVRGLLYGGVDAVPNATTAQKRVASELRRWMDHAFRIAHEAGMEFGYVENQGYVPRVLINENVEADREGFLDKAAEVYGIVFDQEVDGIEPADLVSMARKLANKEAQNVDRGTHRGNFADALDRLVDAIKALAATEDDPNADQAAIQAAADEVQDAADALKDDMREPWSYNEAANWRERIVTGGAMTFNSLGPEQTFSKKRTLPKEADEILADFYEQDALELTMRYLTHVYTRAAYTGRFGKTGGHARLVDLTRRADVQSQMKGKARYDETTPEGRRNIITELSDPSRDNVLEMLLAEAGQQGANRNDVERMRGMVQLLSGSAGQPIRLLSTPLNFIASATTLIGSAVLLLKTPLLAPTEAFVTSLRTGRMKDGWKVFMATVQELRRWNPDVQQRAAIARHIGLVSAPLYDINIMSRASVDPSQNMQGFTAGALSRLHRATGLTQLTNATRRAAMVGGHGWLADLLANYRRLDGKAPSARTKAEAKQHARIERQLGNLGIRVDEIADMAAFFDDVKGHLPSAEQLDSKAGERWQVAISRFVDQTIQEPNQADKPALASTPFGRVVYALTSFIYSFYRNAHLATIQRGKEEYAASRALGESRGRAALDVASQTALPFAFGFAQLWAAQVATTIIREALFNSDQWDKHDDEGDLEEWLLKLATSRSGVAGPWEMLYQFHTGIRYERDLTSVTAGANLGFILGAGQTMMRGWLPGMRNSDKNNNMERKALDSLYSITALPAMEIALSYLPVSGGFGFGARWVAMQALAADEWTTDPINDAVYGPEK